MWGIFALALGSSQGNGWTPNYEDFFIGSVLSAIMAYLLGWVAGSRSPIVSILSVILSFGWTFGRSFLIHLDAHFDKDGSVDPTRIRAEDVVPVMCLVAMAGVIWMPIVWRSANRHPAKLDLKEGAA
jgi:hypothetical protein